MMSKKTKISWRRKMALTTQSSGLFDNSDEPNDCEELVEDWRTLLPQNKKSRMLEDLYQKSLRLMEEGICLAEKQRYWEAINKFNESIELQPGNAKVFEMKSQVLLELGELFPAIQAGELAVKANPLWATAHQTLGRAQISYGEIHMALRSYKIAYHLDPSNKEVLNEDILWVQKLLQTKNEMGDEHPKTT